MGLQRDPGHFRDQLADRVTIRADRQVLAGQHVFQLHSVYDRKYPFQQGLGYLKSNELVILLRGVTILLDLHRVKPKLCFQMRCLVLGIAD